MPNNCYVYEILNDQENSKKQLGRVKTKKPIIIYEETIKKKRGRLVRAERAGYYTRDWASLPARSCSQANKPSQLLCKRAPNANVTFSLCKRARNPQTKERIGELHLRKRERGNTPASRWKRTREIEIDDEARHSILSSRDIVSWPLR